MSVSTRTGFLAEETPSLSSFVNKNQTISLRCASTPSNNLYDPSTTQSGPVSILRPHTLSAALALADSAFPHLSCKPSSSLHLKRITTGAGEIRMTEELWEVFAAAPSENGTCYLVVWEEIENLINFPYALKLRGSGYLEAEIRVKATTPFGRVFSTYAARAGIDPDEMRFCYDGSKLMSCQTVEALGLEPGEEERIDVMQEAVGGKPVIYLFPPSSLPAAQVTLTLSPQWLFSALYPVEKVAMDATGSSTVVWDISAAPNGDLVDLKSKVSLSYLFWEAHSTGVPLSTPSSASNLGVSAFNPSAPFLTASNGVALPLDLFLPYLDKTLSALSLHISARNDFITLWLLHFNRIASTGKQVGFRFLPQLAYEEAAQLKVDPKPDVVTRVFFLFKGVEVDEAEGWKKADEVDWVKVVGVEEEKVKDEGLFRVLEWGGMEVLG